MNGFAKAGQDLRFFFEARKRPKLSMAAVCEPGFQEAFVGSLTPHQRRARCAVAVFGGYADDAIGMRHGLFSETEGCQIMKTTSEVNDKNCKPK